MFLSMAQPKTNLDIQTFRVMISFRAQSYQKLVFRSGVGFLFVLTDDILHTVPAPLMDAAYIQKIFFWPMGSAYA